MVSLLTLPIEVGNETAFRLRLDWLLTMPKITVIGHLLFKLFWKM